MRRRRLMPLMLGSLLWPVFSAQADPLQDGIAAVQRKDYPEAVRLLEPLARAGNASAQLRLGLLYYHGHGVRESDAQALQWFERAARQGLADAQFHLGNMYAYGLVALTGESDPARVAAQWYFEAARQGHADAQYSLGILFLTGSGVLRDEAEARRWIERAAAQGHADAAAYLKGKG
ncbi:tetratricopeptide repeat protein [Piscinibacter defluvii]|uniref:tetratricopeptide repeat protein n=1 Tax=Piscinibacter defluvii TaxID=1796922 RepID=UPI000FDD6CE7|nr:tetratricopeptide repeat protein [Piscinibacter defluvii]